MLERLYQTYLQSRTVTTDSRHITPGCLFFAFKGETFDGNTFAPQALEQGAALCVISNPDYKVDDRCIVVPDVLATLQQLAAHHRHQLGIPFIGITGTNGKTTTKELVHAVLSKRYRTHATAGNYNNHLGVPLTLLAIPADAQIAIIEMGASHPGEIADLCNIADPDFGLITNVGRAHLEGFGSFEGVIRTKTELYRHLTAKGGTAFVNADNDILTAQAAQCGLKTVTYGSGNANTRGTLVGSDPYMHFYFEVADNVYNVRTHLLGNYNFDNCMAAVALGLYFHVEPWDIKEAIEQYEPSNKRSQYKQTASPTHAQQDGHTGRHARTGQRQHGRAQSHRRPTEQPNGDRVHPCGARICFRPQQSRLRPSLVVRRCRGRQGTPPLPPPEPAHHTAKRLKQHPHVATGRGAVGLFSWC